MSELERQLEEARRSVRDRWTAQRQSAVALRVERRQRRSAVARTVAMVGAPLLLIVVVGALRWDSSQTHRQPTVAHESAPRESPSPATPNRTLQLDDGSRAELLNSETKLHVLEQDDSRVIVALQSGGARFVVTPKPSRVFRVRVGQVAVLVVGTVFLVERAGNRARVSVEKGRVRVLYPDGARELSAGNEGWFPPDPAAERPKQVRKDTATAGRGGPKPNGTESKRDPRAADQVEELLIAVDRARAAGKPKAAAAALARVLEEHSDDGRAPLAAFTLGRLLLEQLNLPREAASKFALARQYSGEGPLAEDALAREVEAWAAAGDKVRARVLAERYMRQYPQSARLPAVRKYGGIE